LKKGRGREGKGKVKGEEGKKELDFASMALGG